MVLVVRSLMFFFFNDTATTEIYTLSLHDALPILRASSRARSRRADRPSLGERIRAMLGFDTLWTAAAMVAIVVITAPQIGFSEPDYEPGDIAESEVTAPIDFLVADPLATEARLTAAYQKIGRASCRERG